MTVVELRREIIALGFEEEIQSEALFISSVNRALRDLYNRVPITKTVRLFAKGMKPTTYIKEIHSKNGEEITLPLAGRAYSMLLCGTGNYVITDGNNTNHFQFETSKESKLVRGFITKGGSIRFYGSFSFSIYHFSVYEEAYSFNTSNIPAGLSGEVFDLREIYGDFMSFISAPKDSVGNTIPGCRLADGKLYVDPDYRGEIILTYRRLPEWMLEGVNNEIDLDEEYIHLLPLLVSYYVWLDIDPEKAGYYRARYEDMLEQALRLTYSSIDNNYYITDGWS